MNKSEKETYDRALYYAKKYKEELDTLQCKINCIDGYCTIALQNPEITPEERKILLTFKTYL